MCVCVWGGVMLKMRLVEGSGPRYKGGGGGGAPRLPRWLRIK